MMTKYWSCSKFADWIRGTGKLRAATGEQWDEWHEKAKAAHPIRYWLAEEGLDYLQKAIFWAPDRIHDVKYYINNRWVTRTHALTASARDIPRGEWRDVGSRILPCLFNELQDFVEVELAWWHIAWSDPEGAKKYDAPFWATGWFRWRTWRCPQAGLDSLEWQRHLTWEDAELGTDNPHVGQLTQQAKNAQEILDLYTWWLNVYRNRPDPMDASGWTEYCRLKKEADGGRCFLRDDTTPELREFRDTAHRLCHEIEQAYEREDEEMLIRLIKVRHALCT